MSPRSLMTASAALLAAAGLALLFIPGELQRLVTGAGQSSSPPVVLQLWGASLLGLAAMSWIGRGLVLGGIYGRALVMANLVHWTVGGLTAVREALGRPASGVAWVAVALIGGFAVAFAWLLRRHPGPVSAPVP